MIGYDVSIKVVQIPVKRDHINHTENLIYIHIAENTTSNTLKVISLFLINAKFHLLKVVRYFYLCDTK